MSNINIGNVSSCPVVTNTKESKITTDEQGEEIDFSSLLDKVIKSEEELESDKSDILADFVITDNKFMGDTGVVYLDIQDTIGIEHVEMEPMHHMLYGANIQNTDVTNQNETVISEVIESTEELRFEDVETTEELRFEDVDKRRELRFEDVDTRGTVAKDISIKDIDLDENVGDIENIITQLKDTNNREYLNDSGISKMEHIVNGETVTVYEDNTKDTSVKEGIHLNGNTSDKDIKLDKENSKEIKLGDSNKRNTPIRDIEDVDIANVQLKSSTDTVIRLSDESSILKSAVTNQVEDKIILMVDDLDGSNVLKEAELILNPESLGKINIKMVYTEGKLVVDIEALLDGTKELIIASKEDIVNTLTRETGLQMELNTDANENQIYVSKDTENSNKDGKRQNQSRERNEKDNIAHEIFESMITSQEARVVRAY